MRKNSTKQNTRRGLVPPERHRWVDQWLVAKGQPLRTLVDEIAALVAHHEEQQGLRQRARRTVDATNHHASINVIVSNLAYAILMPPPTVRLAISTRNAKGMTRYDNRALGPKPLRALLGTLDGLGLIEYGWSKKRGEASSLWPSSRFTENVHRLGVTLADFGRDESEEVIVLARSTRQPQDAAKHREMVNYTDIETTTLYRAQVRDLNAFLASAEIAFEDDGLAPAVDHYQRALRRHFTILEDQPEQFDQIGRLFGGFWMTLKSARRSGIRINNEPVAELDYSSMFTRLAYAELGETPPTGDLYAIDGARDHRSGIKRAMNIFLFDTNAHRSKWPSIIGVGVGNDREALDSNSPAAAFEGRLPTGWTVAVTRAAILKKHPALKPAWNRGLGYRLMFAESRIMLAVLERLRAQNVPALPLHDALLVPRSNSASARSAMEQLGNQIAGVELPVSEKTGRPQ